MAFITRSVKNLQTPLNNFSSHFDWSKSLYPDFFWLHKVTLPNRINSVKWLWWILTRWSLFCKSLVRVMFLHMKFGGFLILCQKSTKWITTVQCTRNTLSVFAESHQQHAKSHQLHTMNARSHINSVPWMHKVTSTPYHKWMRSHQRWIMNAHSLLTPSSHIHSI